MEDKNSNVDPYIVVLGIAQDGGYPQSGCFKECCKKVWKDSNLKKNVSCLGLVIPQQKTKFLFDATPDFITQLYNLQIISNDLNQLTGIFLTHAHIGHYTGLINLGRESMNASKIKVYAMPRMHDFLSSNGPWSQLISLKNIELVKIEQNKEVILNDEIRVTPFIVPHRDEFSETVGYKIKGKKSYIFIPDIDKWEKWDENIISYINCNDALFLDATFYSENEIPGRDIKDIPHPLVKESVKLFNKNLDEINKKKIYFIHLNHTNPLLDEQSDEMLFVKTNGFNIAKENEKFII